MKICNSKLILYAVLQKLRLLYLTFLHSKRDDRNFEAEASEAGHGGMDYVMMFDLINAHSRNIGCRRRVLTLVYSNDKRSKSDNNTVVCFVFSRSATDFDHKQCNEDQPSGCLRCAPTISVVCCDMCHPLAFEGLFTPKPRASRGLRKSTVKPYNSDR